MKCQSTIPRGNAYLTFHESSKVQNLDCCNLGITYGGKRTSPARGESNPYATR